MLPVQRISSVVFLSTLFLLQNYYVGARYLGSSSVLESDDDIGYFWQVTDFHYDLNYSADLGNRKFMCWDTTETPTSMNITDAEFEEEAPGSNKPMGPFGDYLCDSPWTLVKSTIEFMRGQRRDADFILWTGDDTSHVRNEFFSTDRVVQFIEKISNEIKKNLRGIPLFPVLGNHDYFPKYDFPDTSSEMYQKVADLWKDDVDAETFQKGAYFTRTLPSNPKLRIVGLNTCLYYKKNAAVNASNEDPAGQFQWFEDTLAKARADEEAVFVIGHVPPGTLERYLKGHAWFHDSYNKRFIRVVQNNSDVIRGMFFAHQHLDSFRMFYDKEGNPINTMFIAPAVTPWTTSLENVGGNNPGVRLYTYNRKTKQVLDYEQFYLNLTLANLENKATWMTEYQFVQTYNLSDMSATSVDSLAQSFEVDDTKDNSSTTNYFEKYYLYNSVSYADIPDCNATCQHFQYCALTRLDFEEFYKCNLGSNSASKELKEIWLKKLMKYENEDDANSE